MTTTGRLAGRTGVRASVMGTLGRVARSAAAAAVLGTVLAAGSAGPAAAAEAAATKVIPLPIRTDGPKSLDPVQGSTTYDNMACAQLYETLLTNKYANPMDYEPLLLAELPTSADGGKTWRFKLKPGVRFHDADCFPGGQGRTVTADDVFYSLKRLGDKKYELENYWLIKNTIVGLDEYVEAQNAKDTFDYDAPVPGFRKISDLEFEIELTQPVTRFLWVLTMFQTSVVPREAVEAYGADFPRRPVGTGPFVLDTWVPKQSLTLNRNPNYHEVRYPARDDWSREDRRLGLHRAAGTAVPIADRLEFTMFVEDQPMWLQFDLGKLGYTEVPEDYFTEAFDGISKQLKPAWADRGIRFVANPLLDFIFRGFNMEDEVWGGYSDDRKKVRQAISLAVDWDEFNKTFYNSLLTIYDGPIPPGLDGHPEGGRAPTSYRGPDIARARTLLAEAGHPNGQGLPELEFYTSISSLNQEMAELLKRQLAEIGIRLKPQFVDFSTLIEFVNKKKAPLFGFAWSSDYPDAENNLALFYGPNEAPGANHFNYKRAEFDEMYRQILTMLPGPERTAIYEKMRDMIIEDVPYLGSKARTRYYLIQPWLKNAKPTERYYGWFKYLDVEAEGASARAE
jgi:ABC-type transport system substrate-binding protein